MVDLDGDVVDVCKEQLPSWNAGSTEDPRLEVIIGDARAYLLGPDSGLFDVVVLDISDPIEAGPAVHLYTREFYELVARKLTPGGILATQSGPAGAVPCGPSPRRAPGNRCCWTSGLPPRRARREGPSDGAGRAVSLFGA